MLLAVKKAAESHYSAAHLSKYNSGFLPIIGQWIGENEQSKSRPAEAFLELLLSLVTPISDVAD